MTNEETDVVITVCGGDDNEELSHRVAKLRGWKYHEDWTGPTKSFMGSEASGDAWESPDGKIDFEQEPPRYASNLNAMYEAESVMTRKQQRKYIRLLRPKFIENLSADWCILHSSARQRAEAFVKIMGEKL